MAEKTWLMTNHHRVRMALAAPRLMDLKAVELLTEREFSLDKELRSIGTSNLLSAFCGMARCREGWQVAPSIQGEVSLGNDNCFGYTIYVHLWAPLPVLERGLGENLSPPLNLGHLAPVIDAPRWWGVPLLHPVLFECDLPSPWRSHCFDWSHMAA